MGWFTNKKEREKLLGHASAHSVLVMDSYLKSRSKHEEKLTIFEAPDLDNNINLICETIFLLGVFDGLIVYLDNKYEHLEPKDVLGFLNAEFHSRPEFEGYEVWLKQAITKGEYVPGSYRIDSVKAIGNLFVAGKLSLNKLMNKEDNLTPEALGLDSDYEFYNFKEFTELRERFNGELGI